MMVTDELDECLGVRFQSFGKPSRFSKTVLRPVAAKMLTASSVYLSKSVSKMQQVASARGSGGSKCWGLCGFADQYAVGGRSCAGADAEQGIEGSMACSAPIEAEHDLVEVMLEVCFPQSVIDAQTPALEV